ncbi:MAG: ATP-binding protein [Azospirillaceae bacterium]|nr:ATP-binding protein [Azospirillaceae bacterium]
MPQKPSTTPSRPQRRGPSSWIKRFLPRTLFGRTTLIIITPLILAQAVATWIFYDRHWETVTRRMASGVAGDIGFLIEQLERDNDTDERSQTLSMVSRHMDFIVAVEPEQLLPEAPPPYTGLVTPLLAQALEERVRRPFVISSVDDKWIHIEIQLPTAVLSVLTPERRLASPTTTVFILWMMGSAMVLFAIAIIFMRNQIRPIRRLAIAAESLGKGGEVPNFRPEGATEVRQAATAFLVMRDRIRRQISQRTEMLAGVSHDLRTPLTRMKLALAMMADSAELEELRDDVAEMETMIEGYLSFARGDGNEPLRSTDLSRLIDEVAGTARRDGLELSIDFDEPIALPMRRNAVKRCLVNLLGNARHHADRAWISVHQQDGTVEIAIDDDGPGIPATAREEVFKPFVQLEETRGRSTGGVGLGLTIARDVVRGHGGELLLLDSPHGGLRALVRLPT